MPACTSNWNWRATPPSRVKIAVPLPYGFSFTSRTASSYVSTRVTPSTGPKISSLVVVHARLRRCRSATARGRSRPRSGAPSRPSTTTVAPSPGARSTYEATLSRCSRVTSGPISLSGSMPVADLDLRDPLLDRLDERVGDVADRDDHRDRHAALAGRAVAGGDGGVGRHVDVGVGQHDHVVLRPAERLAALAVRGRASRRRTSRSASSRRTRSPRCRDARAARRPRPCRRGRR